MTFVAPAGSEGFFDLLSVIGERFPQYLPILSKPGVWGVLQQAIDEKWTPDRLYTALQNTPYFRTTSDQERAWDALQATNPATAAQSLSEANRSVAITASNLGVQLDPAIQNQISTDAARFGWDATRIAAEIVVHASAGSLNNPGLIANKASELMGLAKNYGLNLSTDTLWWNAANIAAGVHPQEQFESYLRQQAIGMFPALTPYLQAGGTVADFAAPYFAMAQQELGINPNTIDLRNPAWQDLFLTHDSNGKQAVRSSTDTLATLRTDQRYGYDHGLPGITEASTLAGQLQTMFGARG